MHILQIYMHKRIQFRPQWKKKIGCSRVRTFNLSIRIGRCYPYTTGWKNFCLEFNETHWTLKTKNIPKLRSLPLSSTLCYICLIFCTCLFAILKFFFSFVTRKMESMVEKKLTKKNKHGATFIKWAFVQYGNMGYGVFKQGVLK